MKKIGMLMAWTAVLALSASANMLVNGSFTVGDGGWTMSSPAMSLVDWGGGDVHSAGGAGVTTYWSEGADGWGGYARQVVALGAERYYDFSVWYQEDPTSNGNPYANVEWADESGVWGDKVEISITRPGGKTWTESSEIGMLAPAYATQARIEIGYVGESFSNTGFFDDAEFSAVPEPVSATLLGLGIFAIYALRKKIRH